jgi:hypothetical protein
MPRESVWHEPVWRHTDEYFARLSDLQTRYPHVPTYELKRLINPSSEAPAKPAPPQMQARRIWPNLK